MSEGSGLRWLSFHVFPGRLLWRPYVERNAGLEVGWLWFSLDIGYVREGHWCSRDGASPVWVENTDG